MKISSFLISIIIFFSFTCVAKATIITTYVNNETQFILDNAPMAMESFETASAVDNSISTDDFTVTWGGSFYAEPYVDDIGATDGSYSIRSGMSDGAYFDYTFSSGIYAFGINMWDYGNAGISTLEFTNDAGDHHSFSISPGGYDFIGIVSDEVFTSIRLRKNGGSHDWVLWDEVYYSGSSDPVPEPATFLLLGSGLTGFAIARRRRQNSACPSK